jgi:hypothetical protein
MSLIGSLRVVGGTALAAPAPQSTSAHANRRMRNEASVDRTVIVHRFIWWRLLFR